MLGDLTKAHSRLGKNSNPDLKSNLIIFSQLIYLKCPTIPTPSMVFDLEVIVFTVKSRQSHMNSAEKMLAL